MINWIMADRRRWTDREVNKTEADRKMDRQRDRQTIIHAGTRREQKLNRQINNWIDSQTDRQKKIGDCLDRQKLVKKSYTDRQADY